MGATEVPNAAVGLYLLGAARRRRRAAVRRDPPGPAAAFPRRPADRRVRRLLPGVRPARAGGHAGRARPQPGRAQAGRPARDRCPPACPATPSTPSSTARYGPGSLEGILRHSPDPESRLRVVLACRSLPERAAVQPAAPGPARSGRRRAPAGLRRARAQGARDPEPDPGAAGRGAAASGQQRPRLPPATHARLAELYWELVYGGLVEGELLAFSLDQVLWHSAEVRRAKSGSPRMALLAGRALLMLDRPDEARAMLEESVRRGPAHRGGGPLPGGGRLPRAPAARGAPAGGRVRPVGPPAARPGPHRGAVVVKTSSVKSSPDRQRRLASACPSCQPAGRRHRPAARGDLPLRQRAGCRAGCTRSSPACPS